MAPIIIAALFFILLDVVVFAGWAQDTHRDVIQHGDFKF